MTSALVALWAASALRVGLGDATFYEASLQTEARAANDPAGAGVVRAVEADPALRLSWLDRGVELGAAYDPRLYLQDGADGIQALHRGSVNGTWALPSRWEAVASAEGMYGMNDFLFQAPAATPATGATTGAAQPPTAPLQPLEPIPDTTTLKYVSGEASAGLDGPLGASFRGGGRVTAFLSGGGDRAARAQLPLQRGARLEGNLGWTASPSDSLASTLSLAVSRFETGLVDALAELKETWHHALSPRTDLRLGAGMAVGAMRDAGQTSSTLLPSGEAGIAGQLLRDLDGDLGVRVTAMIDRVTGSIYDRVDGTVLLRWQPGPSWSVTGLGTGGVVAQGDQAGEKIARADLRLAWSPSTTWEVAGGVRFVPHTPRGFGNIADTSETSVYLSTTVRAHDRI